MELKDQSALHIVTESSHPVVIKVSGELDVSNANQLDEAIQVALRETPSGRAAPSDEVVLDVAGLDFMDSSGLAVFVRAAAGGTTVRLRSPSRIISEIVRATGLDNVVSVE
jgi:anti-anti-sigma factor